MLHGENNPTLTRDTLFAVVMIIFNGMVGLALLVGGLRHREQHYNLQGANAYLGVILPLIAFSLLLPDFTQTTPGPTLPIGQSALSRSRPWASTALSAFPCRIEFTELDASVR